MIIHPNCSTYYHFLSPEEKKRSNQDIFFTFDFDSSPYFLSFPDIPNPYVLAPSLFLIVLTPISLIPINVSPPPILTCF